MNQEPTDYGCNTKFLIFQAVSQFNSGRKAALLGSVVTKDVTEFDLPAVSRKKRSWVLHGRGTRWWSVRNVKIVTVARFYVTPASQSDRDNRDQAKDLRKERK